jgi:KDO2-lipid IV(A) lauroyltransferase
LLDYIAYIAVRILSIIFLFVPVSAALWLGRRMGSIAFFLNRKRRMVAYANLKSAFAKEKTPQELRRITKRVYANLVQTFIEILNLTKVSRAYNDRYVEVVDMERIQNASKSGRGTILLTGHFGDWELSSLTSAIEGFPILVLAREQKMRRLNELLNRLRESKGCTVIRKGFSTKNILKALHEKKMVGILSDQDAGRSGTFVNFFGRPTSTHAGPMEIAKHTDSIVLPNFIVRTHGPYHKLYLEEYIDFRNLTGPDDPSAGSGSVLSLPKDDIKEGLQKFASLLEKYVRKYPDQWLWLHKRWKSTPLRTVLVLNDGKAGHLNQSLAVAKEIRRARMTQGYRPDDTAIVTLDVRYKNKFARLALALCSRFSSWRCHGCMACMRACLTGKSYRTLMETYSDFVVSCGSGLAPVNVYMSHENNATNIVIMHPGHFPGIKKFKLAVIPKHDAAPRARNVVRTTLAPNLTDEGAMALAGERLAGSVRLTRQDAVGLFVGGDNAEFALTAPAVKRALEEVIGFCRAKGAELLVTTSRRTSHAVEEVLKERLKDEALCKLLVIANESNPEWTVNGMLASSRLVVVSAESVSMVSEAISSGRCTIAFTLEKKTRGVTKHERMLHMLEREGHLAVSAPADLAHVMEKAWSAKAPPRELHNRQRIFDAVRRLI